MSIDINKPVKQGHDLVLNYNDGRQVLGSQEDYEKAWAKGQLISLPPNDNPEGPQQVVNNDPEPQDQPVDKSKRRDRK